MKFEKYVKPNFNVLDFGCGGGHLLLNLTCAGKIGIEVNEAARHQCESLGIKTYPTVHEVRDLWADLIISDNALEHTLHPLQELNLLHSKLKNGGQIIFVVPCESISYQYRSRDKNHHLYSWSPMCIGNLFTEAGFVVDESKHYIHKWPPYYRAIAKWGGKTIFDLRCRVYGQVERSWFQVRLIAHKA